MLLCTDCKGECKGVEETFDYAGTHCTYGKSGTHHTGIYVSDCCLAEMIDDSEIANKEEWEQYQ